jgi:exopolyphosphatase/guanosine-5'-triphosphate,3'-diphosphate pyrophosphatase
MEQLAIIDMGSNSIRFVVAQIKDNGAFSFVYQDKETIRLGQGLNVTGALTEEGMEKALKSLRVYKHLMDIKGIRKCLAVATAAVRNASNGMRFLERIKAETGIDMEIIPGEREAYLGYLGAINTIDIKDCLIFDLGGASVEMTLVKKREIIHSVSVPVGAVTITEKFDMSRSVSGETVTACLKYLRKTLGEVKWLCDADLPLVGIGGTARNFAKMDQRAHNYELPTIHNYILSEPHFEEIFTLVSSRSSGNRKKIPGLSSERADVIVAGGAVIKTIFELSGSSELIVSGCGLREGLLYEYYAGYYHMKSPRFDRILEFSVNNYLNNLDNFNRPHAEQVAKVAAMLFDGLRPLHGLGDRVRELLITAALLHDVGKRVNFYNHARHSAFIIGHAPLYGMTQPEQMTAAFIAGFHHGISRKIQRAYRYANIPTEEDWAIIRKMSVLLALAEASDHSYENIVENIDVKIDDNAVVILLKAKNGVPYESADYAMQQYTKSFKKEFGLPLVLIWQT